MSALNLLVNISFASGVTVVDVSVVEVGPNRFRLEGSVVLGDQAFYFGDLIDLEGAGKTREFRDRIGHSPFRTFEYCVPKWMTESRDYHKFLERVKKVGGEWEQIFRGILRDGTRKLDTLLSGDLRRVSGC